MLEHNNPNARFFSDPAPCYHRPIPEMVRDAASVVVSADHAHELARAVCDAVCDRITDPAHWIIAQVGVETARHSGRLARALVRQGLDSMSVADLRDLRDACALAAEILSAHIDNR
jgi:predicted ATPase